MHSYHGSKVNIHHNGGFDGDIIICEKETGNEVKLDSEELLEFVADRFLRRRLIEKIEEMDYKELFELGLKVKLFD